MFTPTTTYLNFSFNFSLILFYKIIIISNKRACARHFSYRTTISFLLLLSVWWSKCVNNKQPAIFLSYPSILTIFFVLRVSFFIPFKLYPLTKIELWNMRFFFCHWLVIWPVVFRKWFSFDVLDILCDIYADG